MKSLKGLFKWAVEAGLAQHDPAKAVPKLRYRTNGFRTWSPEEVRRFEARWPEGSTPRLALTLLLYTGARRSDVVKLGPANLRDGWLTYTAEKTGTEVTIPLLPELADAFNIMIRGTRFSAPHMASPSPPQGSAMPSANGLTPPVCSAPRTVFAKRTQHSPPRTARRKRSSTQSSAGRRAPVRAPDTQQRLAIRCLPKPEPA